MAYTLLIDTSNRELAVGISDEKTILYQIHYPAWQKQSEWTMVEVEKALQATNIKARDLSRIVVANGPGSYTGVRIALTIGKVMASLLAIGLCSLSSLAILAGAEGKKIALIDARSNRAYVGRYQQGLALEKERVLTLEEIHEVIKQYPDFEIVGDAHLVQKKSPPIPYVAHMYALGKIYPDVSSVDALTPRYLKD